MRLHLKTTPNDKIISFAYQQKMVGVLHNWLGLNNEEHGKLSLYSFSWLQNGVSNNCGLNFPNGAKWFISFYDDSKVKCVMKSILNNPAMFSGMYVSDVVIENTPDLSSRNVFYLGSPIFIKKYNLQTHSIKQYTYNDEDVNVLMTQTLRYKMEVAGIPMDPSLNISFDLSFPKKKTKLMNYKGIGNRANLCPVIIDGKPETKAFAWNVGIGNSTGIGFGAIY